MSCENKIDQYVELLKEWAPRINLIGGKDDIYQRHIEDCVQISPLLEGPDQTLLDVGSGAGLPGVVVAIGWGGEVILVEKDKKKTAFLHHVKTHLGLSNVRIISERWEDVEGIKVDIITSRALTSLENLMPIANKFLNEEGVAYFLKGEKWREEVKEARETWEFEETIHRSKTDARSAIIGLRHIRPR